MSRLPPSEEERLRLGLTSQMLPYSPVKLTSQEKSTEVGKYETLTHELRPPQKPPLDRKGQKEQNLSAKYHSSKKVFPTPQLRSEIESKDVTPKKQEQKHCNCKNSKCMKLYCECFASGTYCNGCNCLKCHNNSDNEAARKEAIGVILDCNPSAFKPKIAGSPHVTKDSQDDEHNTTHTVVKQDKGCNCKKSGCLKKYCECYQANIPCSENCRCQDCKNFEGNEERTTIHGHQNSITRKWCCWLVGVSAYL